LAARRKYLKEKDRKKKIDRQKSKSFMTAWVSLEKKKTE
jgi:hypothetical protein